MIKYSVLSTFLVYELYLQGLEKEHPISYKKQFFIYNFKDALNQQTFNILFSIATPFPRTFFTIIYIF